MLSLTYRPTATPFLCCTVVREKGKHHLICTSNLSGVNMAAPRSLDKPRCMQDARKRSEWGMGPDFLGLTLSRCHMKRTRGQVLQCFPRSSLSTATDWQPLAPFTRSVHTKPRPSSDICHRVATPNSSAPPTTGDPTSGTAFVFRAIQGWPGTQKLPLSSLM